MGLDTQREAEAHTFPEVDAEPKVSDSSPEMSLNMDDLVDIKLNVTADLGKAPILVRDIIALKVGSVIPLDKLAGEMTDIYANGLPLARGEVVVIGDSLHVRLAEIRGRYSPVDIQEGDA